MERKIKRYRDLKIRQGGIELVREIYAIAQRLPFDENYGLSSQIKRAADSVPSNIAEKMTRCFCRYFSKDGPVIQND